MILDVQGVGYHVHCSARTLQSLPSPGEAAVLSIETYVREDQIKLFGFRSDMEREWFRLLQTVQGVGAKVALAVLSTLPPSDLANAIALRDKAAVARTPGVGPKVAERIVTELKDKAPAFATVDPAGGAISQARSTTIARRVRSATRSPRWSISVTVSRRPQRHRAGVAQRGRGCGDCAADPAGIEGTGEVSSAQASRVVDLGMSRSSRIVGLADRWRALVSLLVVGLRASIVDTDLRPLLDLDALQIAAHRLRCGCWHRCRLLRASCCRRSRAGIVFALCAVYAGLNRTGWRGLLRRRHCRLRLSWSVHQPSEALLRVILPGVQSLSQAL